MKNRSCCWVVIFCLIVAANLSVLLFTHIRKEMAIKLKDDIELSKAQIQKVELSIIDLEATLTDANKRMNTGNEVTNLENELKMLAVIQQHKATQVKECKSFLERVKTDLDKRDKEKIDNDGEFAALRDKWNEKSNSLKQQLNRLSPVCEHLKNGNANGLCPPNSS